MGRLGVWELLIIFAVLLLLFGGSKLPQLGSSLGSAIRNFKKGFGEEVPEDKAKAAAAKGALSEAGTVEVKDSEKAGTKQS
ncbi:MAG: Sec-independent protein translocase subunit TatA/TatB [Myxococcaceae bacterium]